VQQQCKQKIPFFIQQAGNKQVIGDINHQRQVGHFYKSDIPSFSGGVILIAEKMPAEKQQSPAKPMMQVITLYKTGGVHTSN
jgi:hypothetical protein